MGLDSVGHALRKDPLESIVLAAHCVTINGVTSANFRDPRELKAPLDRHCDAPYCSESS